MRKHAAAVVAVATVLAGCSTHPLPENVTRYRTTQIVNHIRCEAREAIIRAIGLYLRKQQNEVEHEAGVRILADPGRFTLFDLQGIGREVRAQIDKYMLAAIAYDFTFDITEDNFVGTQLDFLKAFTRGTFSLGASASNDVQRETIRNFRITDTFGNLIEPTRYCGGYTSEISAEYPIVGTIGLLEVVTTFVDLNEFQHLASAKDGKDNVPVLSDTFNFQTTVMGTLAPRVVLSPANGLADASLTGTASRRDIHKVIVAMSLPPPKGSAPLPAPTPVVGFGFTPTTLAFRKTPSEQIAILEIYNQITRSIANNLAVRPGI